MRQTPPNAQLPIGPYLAAATNLVSGVAKPPIHAYVRGADTTVCGFGLSRTYPLETSFPGDQSSCPVCIVVMANAPRPSAG